MLLEFVLMMVALGFAILWVANENRINRLYAQIDRLENSLESNRRITDKHIQERQKAHLMIQMARAGVPWHTIDLRMEHRERKARNHKEEDRRRRSEHLTRVQ